MPTFDAATGNEASGAIAVQSFNHTVGTGSARLLIVGTSMYPGNSGVITSVSYGGQELTILADATASATFIRQQIWYLLDPPAGTAAVNVNATGADSTRSSGAISFFDVDQTDAFRSVTVRTGSAGSASLAVTSHADDLVLSVASRYNAGSLTPGAGQTERWELDAGWTVKQAGSTQAGNAPTSTASWTADGGALDLVISNISLRHSAGPAARPTFYATIIG